MVLRSMSNVTDDGTAGEAIPPRGAAPAGIG
jgi:hypothetical protein